MLNVPSLKFKYLKHFIKTYMFFLSDANTLRDIYFSLFQNRKDKNSGRVLKSIA
jgi:hypothetical protein